MILLSDKKITKDDPLIDFMIMADSLTINIELLKNMMQFIQEHLNKEFSNIDVYEWMHGKKPEISRKTYNPQYRAIQMIMQYLRSINLLDCSDVKARGYGIRLVCSVNKHYRYWIINEDNKDVFVKLHEFRNLVTRGHRSWQMDKTKSFKRHVMMYFHEHG